MTQRTISPIDGSVYAERELAGPERLDAVVARAVAAQRGWRATPLDDRRTIVSRFVDWMVDRADDIGQELTWQMGRPIAHSPLEVTRGFLVKEAGGVLAGGRRSGGAAVGVDQRSHRSGGARRGPREPATPLCSVNAVVPALLAGNSVILKAASQTPLVAERYADGLAAAGLPDDVFQYVHTDHDGVGSLVSDPRVGFVAFTGSVPGGHAIQRAAAGRFVATGLELGGKDPAYVRADAPIEATVAELADGAFFNAGQSCCGIERIYVDRSIVTEFVDAFAAVARTYRLGNPLDPATTIGPLVRASAADFVRDQITDAVKQGARPLLDQPDTPSSPYLAPQVLVDVDHSMRIMTEETFGPAVGILAVDSDDEAVDLMNDSPYGLTASIWTTDADAALAIGDRVETGTWYLNRCDYLDPALVWTGIKDSGRGCSLSTLGFHAVTRPKSFHLRLQL